jgi:hypothetical protein
VQSGNAEYSTILVYDVSRWGRFQDADESAYYTSTSANEQAFRPATALSSSRMMEARSRLSSRV